MSRILLLRHGETEGESSIRYHGATDVTLSDLGREQIRAARASLPDDAIDRVVASPLSRAWESACIVRPGAAVVLEAGFREIDFGRWEGLTAGEIEAVDPPLYRAWREGRPDFDYPGGERRSAFRARVEQGLRRQLSSGARSPLIVAHKGVIRDDRRGAVRRRAARRRRAPAGRPRDAPPQSGRQLDRSVATAARQSVVWRARGPRSVARNVRC